MQSEVDTLIFQMSDVVKQGYPFKQLVSYLPPTERYLAKIGAKGFDVLRDIAREPFVYGAITARKSAVLMRDWRIEGNHSDEIEQWLSKLDLNSLFDKIMDTIFFGFQVFEVNWNDRYEPVEVKPVPPELFRLQDGTLVYVGEGSEKIFPEEKFLVCRFGDTYREIYGQALLTKIFWYWEFMRLAIKVWVKYVEKFGIPIADVKTTINIEEMKKLGSSLNTMLTEGVVIHDPNTEIKYIMSNAGQIDSVANLVEACKKAIAVCILGHERAVTTTEGRLGNEWGAIEIRNDIVRGDCRFVESVMEKLIRYWWRFHYGNEEPLPYFVFVEPESLNIERAKRDEILAKIGVPFSNTYWKKNYNLADEDVLFEAGTSNALSVRQLTSVYKQQMLLDEVFEFGDKVLHEYSKEVVRKVKKWLEGKSSLEEALQSVKELYPNLPTKKFLEKFQSLVDIITIVGLDEGL